MSPLNALIRDQVTKLKQSGLKACILKGDRVASAMMTAKENNNCLLIFFCWSLNYLPFDSLYLY